MEGGQETDFEGGIFFFYHIRLERFQPVTVPFENIKQRGRMQYIEKRIANDPVNN